MKKFRKTVKSIKNRNKRGIQIFIQEAYLLKEHILENQCGLSDDYIQSWDDKDKKYMPGMLKVYLDGFEALKGIRYPMDPQLKEIYQFVKQCLRRLKNDVAL